MQKNKLAMCKRIFKDFQAKKLVDDKNFLVIDWKNKNGSGEYSIRYTLDIEIEQNRKYSSKTNKWITERKDDGYESTQLPKGAQRVDPLSAAGAQHGAVRHVYLLALFEDDHTFLFLYG